jgi:1-acyl-sn-glycerol-3-phosphate acyltransferase
MSPVYRVGRWVGRFAYFVALRPTVLNPAALSRAGGFVLAVTHMSHLEPALASVQCRRAIHWVARKEFYRFRPFGWFLRAVRCVYVNRQGVPVSTIRAGVRLAKDGQIVGIFPEGGVMRGNDCVIRGAPMKRGCCSIAIRAGVPVVACVMLGTEKLNAAIPWLPLKRTRVYIAYGEPIALPPGTPSTRATRAAMAERVQASFVQLYADLREQCGIPDAAVP